MQYFSTRKAELFCNISHHKLVQLHMGAGTNMQPFPQFPTYNFLLSRWSYYNSSVSKTFRNANSWSLKKKSTKIKVYLLMLSS